MSLLPRYHEAPEIAALCEDFPFRKPSADPGLHPARSAFAPEQRERLMREPLVAGDLAPDFKRDRPASLTFPTSGCDTKLTRATMVAPPGRKAMNAINFVAGRPTRRACATLA